jgi:hypothetical protein
MSAISGEERDVSYAGSFLLTETHTPDYIDRTFDGPTADDFGGYTRFNYKQQHGGSGNWYKWRNPYTGLLYQANSLSDPLDDLGTVSSGEKETAILHSVQTKTHTAIFVAGIAARADGYDAKDDNDARNPQSYQGTGSNSLKYLDKIALYSNEDINPVLEDGHPVPKSGAKPIKTVHFEYASAAEALSKGVPNASNGAGKLTLKRVWFEYQGITTQISPYTFSYAYPTRIQNGSNPSYALYPSKYTSGINDVTGGFGATNLAQNPDYTYFNLDAWGNYQNKGATRFVKQQSWVDQKSDSSFDPAAWQLKVITLPTGGQIHVQYEQDDYAYVQDKPAHVMVPLKPTETGAVTDAFALDLAEIGITTSADCGGSVKTDS